MTRKEQLLYMLEKYKSGKYTTNSFCEQFVEIYSEDVKDEDMSNQEKEYMEQFCRLSERFTPYEEDLELDVFFIDDKTFRRMFDDIYKHWLNKKI